MVVYMLRVMPARYYIGAHGISFGYNGTLYFLHTPYNTNKMIVSLCRP